MEAPAAGIEPGSPQDAGTWPARCGGDVRSPRKPAGPDTGSRGLPGKARSRPNSLLYALKPKFNHRGVDADPLQLRFAR